MKHDKQAEIGRKLDWLNEVMQATGLKATPLAKAGGVSPSTITRFIKDPENSRVPMDRTLDAIAIKLGLPTYTGMEVPKKRASPLGFADDGAVELNLSAPEADEITNTFNFVNDKKNQVKFWIMKGPALENEGILDGDVMVVDYTAEPKQGDICLVSLRDEERATAKSVFRILMTFKPATICITATNNQSIAIEEKIIFVDGITARIYGVVSMSFRHMRQ